MNISEFDLDELAIQVKQRIDMVPFGFNGYNLYCLCKDVFIDYFEVKFNQEATFEVPEKEWGYSINYIAEDSLNVHNIVLSIMSRIDIIVE